MKKQILQNTAKGVAIGASMLIPGVSGGTMAIILGIYDDIIHAVSGLTRNFRKNIVLLLEVGLGAVIGMFLLAKLLLKAVTAFEMPMMFLFLGAIAGSIPTLIKKAELRRFNWTQPVYFLIGLGAVLLLSFLPQGLFEFTEIGWWSFFLLLLAGVVIAVALVLPGISASYMLLMLGIYNITLAAITEFNLLFLAPLIIGVLAGTLMTTKLLEKAMNAHPAPTYLMITGFVAGSVMEVFPGVPTGLDIPICIVTLLAGFFAISVLSGTFRKKS